MRILGVTTERQRYTYRIGAALASVVRIESPIPGTAQILVD